MSIELTVHGEPAACRAAAGQVDDVKAALETLDAALTSARTRAVASWEGPAAAAFLMDLGSTTRATDEITGKLERVSAALTTFAGTLTQVRSAMADARSTAAGGGCAVSGDVVQRPDDLSGEITPAAADAHARKVAAYNQAFAIAEAARDDERRAHETLQGELDGATGPGFLEGLLQDFGVWPKGEGAGWDLAAALGIGGLALGSYAGWATTWKYGRYQPTWGPFSALPRNHMARSLWANDPWWRSMIRHGRDANYTARPGMSATRGAWSTTGTWLARGGAVLEGGLSGYDQWQADADNPALNGSERVARSGTVGVTTGLGAYGGAVAGAQVGAAIGSVFPGPGTAIGGILGGAIGGFAGSQAGQAVGDFVKDEVGAAAHWAQDTAVAGWDATAEFAGDAWDSTTEAASDAWDSTTDLAGDAWDSTTDAAGQAWDAAGDRAGELADGAGDLIDGAGDLAGDVGDKLTFWD